MKHFLLGMKNYTLLMVVVSCILTIVTATLLFLFGSHNGKTIGDVLELFWVKWYLTGSLLGGAAYKYHIVGLIVFGLLNVMENKR